ncbi:hypothetical protein VU04_09645 [Desulfobulbus sp. TB]|nr:hypothetical protein [Desulfobulbus sp. TB]
MKDSELRGLVLQYFYDRRSEKDLLPPKPADLGVEVNKQDIFRICGNLGEKKLLKWTLLKVGLEVVARSGEISAFGVDVVEGEATPADIKVKFVQHNNNTVTITESTGVNNIIGSNNTLTLPELTQKIESADATPQEKEEAKSLLRKILENPTIAAVLGGSVRLLGS